MRRQLFLSIDVQSSSSPQLIGGVLVLFAVETRLRHEVARVDALVEVEPVGFLAVANETLLHAPGLG